MKSVFCYLAGLTMMATSLCAQATEGGTGHYLPGAMASFIDVLPSKPSVALFNYATRYHGNARASQKIQIAGQVTLNVDATFYADTVGAFWVTPLKIFNAYYAMGLALPMIQTTVAAQVSANSFNVSARKSKTVRGLGDLEFWPIALSWSALNDEMHVDLLGGVYAPSGDYQKYRLANQGLNYWTFTPGVLVSYLGKKHLLEFTTYMGYDFNTENESTHYHSGEVFHIDATAAQHIVVGKGMIGFGANAYYLQQITGDRGNGALLGQFKERIAGVGPVVSYAGKAMAIELKWLPELSTKNTLKGDYFWLKIGVQI